MKLRIAWLGLSLIAGLAGSAAAHGVWLAQRYGQTLPVYGHGAGDDPYDPAKIKMVRAFDPNGGELAPGVVPRERHAALELPEEAALVAVHFDNGDWTKRADRSSVNERRSAVPAVRGRQDTTSSTCRRC